MCNWIICICIALLLQPFSVIATDRVSTGTGLPWGTGTTWSPAGIPVAGDNITILAGHAIRMNGNAGECLSLNIQGTANWTQGRTTNVGAGGLVMNGGTISGSANGTLNVAGDFTTLGTNNIGACILNVSGLSAISATVNLTSTSGSKTFNNLTITGTFNNSVNEDIVINGNLQNDGTFNMCMGCTGANARVTFGNASSNTVTGTSTTGFNTITVDKGASSANIIDLQSAITLANGGLTLTNGTFKLSNASTITTFTVDITAAPYLIPSTTALWCNGGTINSGNHNWTVAGELRVSSGTVTVGANSDNSFRAENSGTTKLTVEGGSLNVAGRIARVGAGDFITMNVSGGIITVPTIGSTLAAVAPFHSDQASSIFNWSAGTIVIQRAGAGNLGFAVTAGTNSFAGGILQIGNSSTPASQTILVNSSGSLANLTVNSSNATAQQAINLTVLQAVNITAGTLNANNFNLTVGGLWANSGTFTPGTGTVTFNGTGTQSITKIGGEAFYNFTVNKASGTVSLVNDLGVSNILTMTAGNIDCGSSTLTLGTSIASIGTLTYTSGTIIGCLKRWLNATATAYLFPIGTSSYYRPVQITFNALTAGTLTSCFVSTDPGNSGLPLSESGKTIPNQYTEGYWNLTAANGLVSTDYNLDLTGTGFISYPVSPSTRILYRATSGNPWSLNGVHAAGTGSTVKRIGVGGLSAQFCFGKPTCSAYMATSVGGDAAPCISTAAGYTVNASNPLHSYTWTITPPAAGSVTSGQGTPTATITWGAAGQSATVSVTEQNDCGDNNTALTYEVNVNPIATSTITGSASVSTSEVAVYSVTNTSGYTYTWSFPSGGGSVTSGQGTNSVTITWGTTAGAYTVTVTTTRLCGGQDVQNLAVTVRSPLYSRVSGSWSQNTTWSNVPCGGTQTTSPTAPTVNDECIICSAHTVTMNNNGNVCKKLAIDGIATWAQARTTTVGSGGVTVSSTGNITGAGAGFLISEGGFTGVNNGNISSTSVVIRLQTNPQNISSAGALNLLDVTTTATNTGTVTVTNTLSGAGTFTQGASSTLNMNGATFSLTTFNASASGNTVNYGASAAQAIKGTTYHHLTASGAGTKTLSAATVVNGDLNISSATTVLDISTNNYALSVGGNWSNSGSFTERFGTVTFNGSSAQIITATGGETFNNLTMTGSGAKYMGSPLTINFDFALSSTLNANSNNISIRGNFDNSGTYNGGSNDVTFTNNTSILGSSTTTFNNVIITGTLTGHSSNLNVTGNWTNNGTFNNNSGTVTFTGAAQSIGGYGTNTFHHLTLSGTDTKTLAEAVTANGNLTINSTFDVSASNFNVNVKGNWVNNGAFTPRSGTVTFNGTAAQTIGGTTATNSFHNITQNNAAGVSLSENQDLLNTLTISAGTFTTTGKNFALKSTASNTARIAAIPTGADFAGNIIMERYTGTGPTDWRFFSSAVSGATIADWADDFATSGFPGSTDPGNSFVSIYSYDETASGDKEQGYVPATNVTNPIVNGTGYWVYLGPNPATYEVTGPPNKSTQPFTVNYTSVFGTDDDGWNLISNPYPAAIDWDAATDATHWGKTNLDAAVYVYNSSTGTYAYHIEGCPACDLNGGSRYIASQQAFWVKANAAGASITFREDVKETSDPLANPSYLKTARNPNTSNYPMAFKDFPVPFNTNNTPNSIKLTASGGGYDDEMLILFTLGASEGFDSQHDAFKLVSSLNISSVITGNQDLAISQLPPSAFDVEIPIRLTVPASGTYSIRRDSMLMLSQSSCVVLEDKLTGTLTDLRDNISYSFTISDTTIAPRFVLHISPPIYKQTVNALCSGSANGRIVAKGTGIGPWGYTWKNASGAVIKTTPSTLSADSIMNLSSGTYSVEIAGMACGTVNDTFVVSSPSPLELNAGFSDVSCNGQSDGSATVNVTGGTLPYTYLWSNGSQASAIGSVPAGEYTVTVTDVNGCAAQFFAAISDPVQADFAANIDTAYISLNDTVRFGNASSGARYYEWDFGDASGKDTALSPRHFYPLSGTYTVTLVAHDSVCFDTTHQLMVVMDSLMTTDVANLWVNNSVNVLYEDGNVFLNFGLKDVSNIAVSIYSAIGETVLRQFGYHIQNNRLKLNVDSFTPGIYLARIELKGASITKKIIIHNK